MRFRPFAITLQHDGNVYEGKVVPYNDPKLTNTYPTQFAVTLNGIFRGVFTKNPDSWESTSLDDAGLVQAIGFFINDWYQ